MAEAAAAAAAGLDAGVDRLSDLPDGILGHILSFLPTYEAGRGAVLSSRWRYILASVHTFSFDQPESPFDDCDSCYYSGVDEKKSLNSYFLNDVTAAFLCRRRCAGCHDPPLRALRVSFEWFHDWDGVMVHRWLDSAMQNGANKELHHLDVRRESRKDSCERVHRYRSTQQEDRMYEQVIYSLEEDEDDLEAREDFQNFTVEPASVDDQKPSILFRLNYVVPKSIFACASLRTLCLVACIVHLPTTVLLPSLETLLLTGLLYPESDKEIQRLISSCPRLVDLTLEACTHLRTISILDKRLRRLALRCCHKLLSVNVDASDLRDFEYRGVVPAPWLLTLQGVKRISSCSIDFCGKKLSIKGQFVWFKRLLKRFVDTTHLHLRSARLGSGMEDPTFNRFPVFCRLRHLDLAGSLQDYDAVDAVTRILKQAPNLEVLSLVIIASERYPEHSSHLLADWEGDTAISCLMNRVREIKIVDYQGLEPQKTLLKFLLHSALVLDAVFCVFPKRPQQDDRQTEMINEIKGWAMNKSAKITFE